MNEHGSRRDGASGKTEERISRFARNDTGERERIATASGLAMTDGGREMRIATASGLAMTTETAERQSAVPTETAAGEEPCCLTCGEFRMKVIDDFPIGYCPYLAGPMGDPLKVCCEQYYKAAGGGK